MALRDVPDIDHRSPNTPKPWAEPLSGLLSALEARDTGLSSGDAARRLGRDGPNAIAATRKRPLWLQIIDRLSNPLILILLFASALSASTGETASFVIIVLIIAMSVVLDLVQQARAEATVEALRRWVGLRAAVLRDGAEALIDVASIVRGDVVRLSAGDVVPADCRLIAARDLFVNQAVLTGESYPVEKHARDFDTGAADDLAAAANTLFMGTSVISGTASALVYATGAATEFGGVAGTLETKRPADSFESGIRRFGMLLLRLTIFLVLFVIAANLFFGRPWLQSMLFALALAVGLTPELLPMVVTVTLANGAKRLAARRVIVKRLAAIHDLGAIDVLCSDKTGTLTEARMKLVRHLDPSGDDDEEVFRLVYLNSAFETGLRSPLDDAVLDFRTLDIGTCRKIDEVPFDFERRRVSVLVEEGGRRRLIVKGAPEDIIRLSTSVAAVETAPVALDRAGRERLTARFEALGADGFRVLGVASREVADTMTEATIGDEAELTFNGFAVFLDPPKPEAAEEIRKLAAAGCDVKILTGDNERITRHICQTLGIDIRGVVTGDELSRLSQEALKARLDDVNLFCRVTPQQKERVLLALKSCGRVVGFLGDGINDASALHAADVGISVDSAVDVAKEAADLVLLEHDLGAIYDGVMEGRRTVENVNKYLLMGSSSNLGNMFSMAGAALFLPFLPMLPTQVLLNNLLYDLSEVGVPFDDVDAEAIAKPLHWDISFVERFMLVIGPISSLFDFLTFYALIKLFGAGEAVFQTGWFVESLATQALVIFVIRTRRLPWRSRPHKLLTGLTLTAVATGLVIPLTPLGSHFGFVPPPPGFYVFLIVAVAAYLSLVELVKRGFYAHYRAGRAG